MLSAQHADLGYSKWPFSRAFRMYPTYPYLSDSQWTQMRQQWIRALKTLRVGMISTVPGIYLVPQKQHLMLSGQNEGPQEKSALPDQTP